MKIKALAVLAVTVMPLTGMRAGGREFVIDDRDATNSAEEISSSRISDRPMVDPQHSNGILLGKPIFRLDPKYGDVCLQTVFGNVNGAELRVTW